MLDTALHADPLSRLRQIVGSTPALGSGSVMRAWRENWTRVALALDGPELDALIRLLTVAEHQLRGWSGGSVSAVIWLFPVYARSNPDSADELGEWVLGHTANDWLRKPISRLIATRDA